MSLPVNTPLYISIYVCRYIIKEKGGGVVLWEVGSGNNHIYLHYNYFFRSAALREEPDFVLSRLMSPRLVVTNSNPPTSQNNFNLF